MPLPPPPGKRLGQRWFMNVENADIIEVMGEPCIEGGLWWRRIVSKMRALKYNSKPPIVRSTPNLKLQTLRNSSLNRTKMPFINLLKAWYKRRMYTTTAISFVNSLGGDEGCACRFPPANAAAVPALNVS